MRDLMASLQYVDNFLIYLALTLTLFTLFVWIYGKITPYDELELIRNGNTAAAIAYGGAIIGLALPLASAVAHSVNPVDMVAWGLLALAVQVLVYFLVRRLVPHLNANIPQGKVAPAVLLAATSVAAGILNAACLTY